MPNQPIKNIQLKNGSKYPVSPAYRAPIIDGDNEYGPTDYPFAYEESPTGAGSFQIVTSVGDAPVNTKTYVLYPISDHEFSQTEFAGMSLEGSSNGVEAVATDPMISDPNTLVSMLMADNGVMMSAAFSGLAGDVACFSIGNYVLGVVSFDAAGTTTDTEAGDSSGTPVNVTATITVPAAGSYWMYTANTPAGISGTITVGKYTLDRRYYNGGIVTINNVLLGLLLSTGTAQSITPFPSVEEKLIAAATGIPLAICFGVDYFVAVSKGVNGGLITWRFADGSTLAYHQTNHTLTYTAGS